MAPPPSPRRSPKEIFHKRGHNFGGVLPVKAKDDELLLFTDLQKHERDNFLLEPADDFDESISKFSYFRDAKIGGHIATRGENHDFLNIGGERNDYDWLLTPPETPLFHSFDDEEDHHIGLARRGRAPIKPISISRSSTMDNTRRSNRSSASPSPRSCGSTVLTRTRSSNSSSQYSPPPLALQPSSRRSSTPQASKTLTPPRRSPSPASRRMNTGSSDPLLNGKRGTSPVKGNQRSPSPGFQGWRSSDPGFSFEAPPNLRISLSDRPVSRSRGGSPSSFSGLDMGGRGRRKSMFPTPSRRASSSHSNDRDRFSSYRKPSATSSVEDHRKAPQDMFRPLLSSVPSNTFGVGKGNDAHQPTISHNSSLTVSSYTNSEHHASLGLHRDNEKKQHVAISECEVASSSIQPDCPQCSFTSTQSGPESPAAAKSAESTGKNLHMGRGIDAQASCSVTSSSEAEHCKMATCAGCGKLFNGMKEDGEVDYCEECALIDEDYFVNSKIQNVEEVHQQDANVANPKPCITSEAPELITDCSKSIDDSSLDSQLVNDEPQCNCLQKYSPSQSPVTTTEEMMSQQHVENVAENIRSSNQCSVSYCQQIELTSIIECEILSDRSSNVHNGIPQCLPESICDMDLFSDTQPIDNSYKVGSIGHPNLKTENTNGIPLLLLQNLSSNKWPIIEGTTFAPTNTEPCYARVNVHMSKCTTGQDSSSASSSIDQGSYRQSDVSESSTSNRICAEELDGSCKYNLSSAIECWSAAQAIVNDDSESFGSAAIQKQYKGGMAQEGNLIACLCSSDTEMHSNIPLLLAPEESYVQNAEEDTSATTQCYPVSTPEHATDECCSDNKLDDCCVSIISEEDMFVSVTEAITTELGDDESLVRVEGSREKTQRCFTLQEATDTILFCSSIVHEIAYRAATIGLEHEQKSELACGCGPTVTIVQTSIPKGDSSLKLSHKPIPKHRKKSEGVAITETDKMEVVGKDPGPACLVPEFSRTSDSTKLSKLESKCNCAIM